MLLNSTFPPEALERLRAQRLVALNQAKAQPGSISGRVFPRVVYGDAHPKVAKALGNVGIDLAQQGKKAEARPYFEQALAALIRIHGPDHPVVMAVPEGKNTEGV